MTPTTPFLTFIVEACDHGRSLQGILRSRFGMSRALIRRLKRPECVRVDGRSHKVQEPVYVGQHVALYLPQEHVSAVRPEPMPLTIRFEDEHLLVVDKAAGILVHPSGVDRGGTLINAVAHHLTQRGEPSAAGPVTRLDRDTSGLVLFAKHPHAHYRLDRSLAVGTLVRKYTAIVHGRVEPDKGWIDAPIRRAENSLSKRTIAADGQPARTYFRVIARFALGQAIQNSIDAFFSQVELTLQTGRTHQIRLHLAHIGHPVVGDALYGTPRPHLIARQALHAHRLTFPHPISEQVLTFCSPLPPDMTALVATLDQITDGNPSQLKKGSTPREPNYSVVQKSE